MIQTVSMLGKEGMHLNIKAIASPQLASFSMKNQPKAFPLGSGRRQECHHHHFYSMQYWKS
jgi:hypothetical protein